MAMRAVRAWVAVAWMGLLVAGCSDNGGGGQDGGADLATGMDLAMPSPDLLSGDWTCIGKPWPTTAPDPLQLGGTVDDAFAGGGHLAGALVEVVAKSNDALLGMSTADSGGAWSVSLTSGGNAIDNYKRVTLSGRVTTYQFPPYAQFKSAPMQSLPMFTTAELDQAATNSITVDTSKAVVGVRVLDCAGTPVAGASVTSPSGTVVYSNDAGTPTPSLSATSTRGEATIFNVEVSSSLQLQVTAVGVSYRAWPVKTFAGAFTLSPRLP